MRPGDVISNQWIEFLVALALGWFLSTVRSWVSRAVLERVSTALREWEHQRFLKRHGVVVVVEKA